MAQVTETERLQRIVSGDVTACEGLSVFIDRERGSVLAFEGPLLDFKARIQVDDQSAIAETARDVMGFANTDGGILLVGVSDSRQVVGYELGEPEILRERLGPFMGTRVDFDVVRCELSVQGRQVNVLAIVVRRSLASYPILLRRDIEYRRTLQKVKYSKGALFYRQGSETLVEPPLGDVDGRATELGFTSASPRTRSSFVLKEDRPLLRLYENINERFFGRDTELAELVSKFDDPRGKGVSIAGIGGVGKTELAITLVRRLVELGKFKVIYSGSAKKTVLTPVGPQLTDPAFIDLPSFLKDLAAWLGFSATDLNAEQLQIKCVDELRRHDRVLLFIDNLETVHDSTLFSFIDNGLPSNCWVITTGRVHKIRNFVFPKELVQLQPRDAARLLRYELKRQALPDLSSKPIGELEQRADQLYCHPLALRWFAWACRKDPQLWVVGIQRPERSQLEDFCVTHTLSSLSASTQKVLGAVVATSSVTESTTECVSATSGIPSADVEVALYELECAGLVLPVLSESSGAPIYVVAPLAETPASQVARAKGWERDYTSNLRGFLKAPTTGSTDAVTRDLLDFPLWRVKGLTISEIADLEARVRRVEPRCPIPLRWYMKALLAECQRHQHNLVSSDDMYRAAADQVLELGGIENSAKAKIQVLLEAATVAKARANTPSQLQRALTYLTAIEHTDFAPHRVLGMLAEFAAANGDVIRYRTVKKAAEQYSTTASTRISKLQREALKEALRRAEDNASRTPRR